MKAEGQEAAAGAATEAKTHGDARENAANLLNVWLTWWAIWMKSLREARGLSKEELAEEAGVPVAVIEAIERGEESEADFFGTVNKLAKALRTAPKQLIAPTVGLLTALRAGDFDEMDPEIQASTLRILERAQEITQGKPAKGKKKPSREAASAREET